VVEIVRAEGLRTLDPKPFARDVEVVAGSFKTRKRALP
jgi:hypothetical protein